MIIIASVSCAQQAVVQRQWASAYLKTLVSIGLLEERKAGRASVREPGTSGTFDARLTRLKSDIVSVDEETLDRVRLVEDRQRFEWLSTPGSHPEIQQPLSIEQ